MGISIAKSVLDRTPTGRSNTRRAFAALAAGLTLGLFVGASQASASDDFEAAFEREMGRIAARHVAAIGHLFLFGFPHAQPVFRADGHRHHCGCGHAAYQHLCKKPVHSPRHERAKVRHCDRRDCRDGHAANQRHADRPERHARGREDDRRRERGQERGHRDDRQGKGKERREEHRVAFRH